MPALNRFAALLLCALLGACAISSTSTFEGGPSQGKAIVIVGGAFLVPDIGPAIRTDNIEVVAAPLRVPAVLSEAEASFRRYDPATGEDLDKLVLEAPSPELVPVPLSKPNSLLSLPDRTDRFGTMNYAIVKVTPGDWFLDRQIVRSMNRTTIVRSVKENKLRAGVPVFHIEAGEVLYVGDVVLASGQYLRDLDPEEYGRLRPNSWNLAIAGDVETMKASVAERINTSLIRYRPMLQFGG
ncbi:hypothetical protein [Nisaea sp.]|uniref:hypothetical protein n=1 Tax=Nisaea sp. TaxID=2024842 RepID=UPI003B52F6E5